MSLNANPRFVEGPRRAKHAHPEEVGEGRPEVGPSTLLDQLLHVDPFKQIKIKISALKAARSRLGEVCLPTSLAFR